MPSRPPSSTLFPYTTLFRSRGHGVEIREGEALDEMSRVRPNDGRRVIFLDHVMRARGHRHVGRKACERAPAHSDDRLETATVRSEEHTSELQSPYDLVCRLL